MTAKSPFEINWPLERKKVHRVNGLYEIWRHTNLRIFCLFDFVARYIQTQSKGQLISEWLLDVFIWTKKQTKIFLYFCPKYLSKISHIKKECNYIILEDKQWLISMIISHWFMIWPILEARAEIQKYFRSFFGSNEDIQKSL